MIKSMTRSSVLTRTDYRSMLAGNDAFIPGAYELISSTVLTSSAASVSFSGIVGTYKHLQIRYTAKTSVNATTLKLQFNSDTSALYDMHHLLANGTSVISDFYGANQTFIELVHGIDGSSSSSAFVSYVGDILDYASTSKNKTIRSLHGGAPGANNRIILTSGLYRNTAAISSITFTPVTASLQIGSRFSLYGIKG